MTAPSLVLLGNGSDHPGVAQVSHGIRDGLLEIRPELDVHVAFVDPRSEATTEPLRPPTATQVVNKLVKRGVEEVVFLPLLLSSAFHGPADLDALVAQLRTAHPSLRCAVSRPVGPEAQLLAVVDRRLREALRASRVSELDGLVFAAAGSEDVRSNSLVSRRARQWATHHKLPCVTAFASGSGPSTAEAVRTLRAQGRRHIAVGSWFLAPDPTYARQSGLALEMGAIAVAEPMGPEPEVIETALARYLVAAMELVDLDLPEIDDDEEPTPVRHLAAV
jgi:sirohydrochlorin ferrochelatase